MIGNTLELIHSGDTDHRREALSDLGDYFDYMDWNPSEVAPLITELVTMLQGEQNEETKEIILNDLMTAFARGKPLEVSLWPLVSLLTTLSPPLAIYALEVLALSHNDDYRAAIEWYCSDPREELRNAAKKSLIELGGHRFLSPAGSIETD